ncbi:MAG: hypothetical protein ACOX4T_03145 [Acetivibrionales bacterium]
MQTAAENAGTGAFRRGTSKLETVTAGQYFDELDPQDEETVRYACADSDYACGCFIFSINWFDRYLPKHRFIVEKLESPAAVYCGLMKHNGLLADEN